MQEKSAATRTRRGTDSWCLGDGEAGSAYITTLLVLVLMTALGVSVGLVTQTEVLIGSADRMIHVVFYAADSGVAASTAKALVEADFDSSTVKMVDDRALQSLNLRQEVEMSPFYPTLEAPCNLCQINNVGTYDEESYRAINYAITATATRRAGGSSGTPLAQATVGSIVEVQPWKAPTEAYAPIDNAGELRKIKF